LFLWVLFRPDQKLRMFREHFVANTDVFFLLSLAESDVQP